MSGPHRATARPSPSNTAALRRIFAAEKLHTELVAALWHALEALEYAAPNFEATGEGGEKTVDIVREVLAKAEGRQP